MALPAVIAHKTSRRCLSFMVALALLLGVSSHNVALANDDSAAYSGIQHAMGLDGISSDLTVDRASYANASVDMHKHYGITLISHDHLARINIYESLSNGVALRVAPAEATVPKSCNAKGSQSLTGGRNAPQVLEFHCDGQFPNELVVGQFGVRGSIYDFDIVSPRDNTANQLVDIARQLSGMIAHGDPIVPTAALVAQDAPSPISGQHQDIENTQILLGIDQAPPGYVAADVLNSLHQIPNAALHGIDYVPVAGGRDVMLTVAELESANSNQYLDRLAGILLAPHDCKSTNVMSSLANLSGITITQYECSAAPAHAYASAEVKTRGNRYIVSLAGHFHSDSIDAMKNIIHQLMGTPVATKR